MPAPDAIIKEGKVINGEQLRHYWRVWREQDNIRRRAMFEGLIYRSLCQYQGWLEPGPDILEEEPRELIPEPQPMRIYLNIDRKSLELQKRIALLETSVNTLKEIKTKKKDSYTIS